MATVAELKAGECDWEVYLVKCVGLQFVKRMGLKEGPRNTKVNLVPGSFCGVRACGAPGGCGDCSLGPWG